MLEQFKELGYVYQLPQGRDKTLYLVKQEKELTKQIFVEYSKKYAKVYPYNIIKANKKLTTLEDKEVELIMNYLLEQGITEYEIIKEEE